MKNNDRYRLAKEAYTRYAKASAYRTDIAPDSFESLPEKDQQAWFEAVDFEKDRATGRTTRIIDEAIQTLFKEGKVTIRDHEDIEVAHRSAFDRFFNRIQNEFPSQGITFDYQHRTAYKGITKSEGFQIENCVSNKDFWQAEIEHYLANAKPTPCVCGKYTWEFLPKENKLRCRKCGNIR